MKEYPEILKRVSQFVGIEQKIIYSIFLSARRSYARYFIPKRKVESVKYYILQKEVKSIQYALINLIFDQVKLNDIAMAYRFYLKSPIKSNANLHKEFRYSVRIDFKDFFPSLRPEDLFRVLNESKVKDQFEINSDFKSFISNICFYSINKKIGLPIGAPSSPIISNIIMRDLDKQIHDLSTKVANDSVVTRYADDVVFSANEKGLCHKFYAEMLKLVDNTKSPSLDINKSKTLFMSRKNKRIILGLVVTPDGNVSIGRSKKRYIKKLIFDYTNGKLDKPTIAYLKGYLCYILDVEETFYNSLVVKYGTIVNDIRTSP